MRQFTILSLMICASVNIFSQTYTISFEATGIATILDSVKVENLSNPATVTWHAGDVLQLIVSNGINNLGIEDKNLKVYPNPMQGHAEISFHAKQGGNAVVKIYDIAGKEVLLIGARLIQGTQNYQLQGLKQGMYFIDISGNGYLYSSKLISQNATPGETKIKYLGNGKSELVTGTIKSSESTITMPYTVGDNLRFTGYAGGNRAIINDEAIGTMTVSFIFSASLIEIETVQIPAGTFTMGSPSNEIGRMLNETQYQVTLSAFKLSKYEITNAQYATFLNAKSIGSDGIYAAGAYPTQALIYPSHGNWDYGLHYSGSQWEPVEDYENNPVTFVTWYGAVEFATYVSGRLPTEAEWEYACRATTATPFNTGACLSDANANYNWSFHYTNCTNTINLYPGTTLTIGTYAANAYGLYDMHGNVNEWCSDWFGDYPTTPQINPIGHTSGTGHICRGGSWCSFAQFCRCAYRLYYPPETREYDLGFRVVLPQ